MEGEEGWEVVHTVKVGGKVHMHALLLLPQPSPRGGDCE